MTVQHQESNTGLQDTSRAWREYHFYHCTIRPLKVKQLTSVSTIFGWPWPNWASANTNAQFGIINNQQPLSSHHHPWHLAPLPHVTTVPNSHSRCRLPSTAYNHSTWPPMAMWQHHITSHNDHQDLPLTAAIDCLQPQHTPTNGNVATPHHSPQWPPERLQTTKNAQERTQRTQTTPPLTNEDQHLWTDTGDDAPRWASSLPPPFFFSNTKCRCHVAVSDVATKWWTTDSSFIVIVRAPL